MKPAYDAGVVKRWLTLVAGFALGCGHTPGDAPIDARPDAPIDAPGVPDLQPIAARMTTYSVAVENIKDDPTDPTDPDGYCQVVEGCVAAAGARTLLRFPTVTGNIGTADLVMPPLPAPGVSDAVYDWSPCHGKHHVHDFALFELVQGTDTIKTVKAARKQAFCLEDSASLASGGQGGKFTCTTRQGISVGWTDVYVQTLACEYIDVTDVTPGDYTLRITINPDHNLPDRDLTNNVFTMPVTLPAQPPPATP